MQEQNLNIQKPECIKNNISLKVLTINQLGILANFFKENNYADYQVLLLTPFGFIKGDIENLATNQNFITETDSPNKYNIDISVVYQFRNDTLIELEKDNKTLNVIDNGALINLKNVTIYKDNLNVPILTTNQMILFVDQIISFSLFPRNL